MTRSELQSGQGAGERRGSRSGAPLTGQTFDVVAGALHKVASCMENLGPKQSEAARLLRLGQMDSAFPVMTACLGLWQEVQVALAAAASAIGQPVEFLVELVLAPAAGGTGREGGSGETGKPLAELAGGLQAVKRYVEARDWIGVADALEYDLGDLARRWRAALLQSDDAEAAAPATAPGMARSAPAA